jgi:hypothetical protein
MSTRFRDLYKQKVKRAIPVTDDEMNLFELAMREKRLEEIADAVAEKLTEQQNRRVGAPRKTGGDVELVSKLVAEHQGDTKLARQDFIRQVCARDHIAKKRARERFNAALKKIDNLET